LACGLPCSEIAIGYRIDPKVVSLGFEADD